MVQHSYLGDLRVYRVSPVTVTVKSRTFRHQSTVRLNSYTNYDAAGKEHFVFHLENQVHEYLMVISGLRNKYIVDELRVLGAFAGVRGAGKFVSVLRLNSANVPGTRKLHCTVFVFPIISHYRHHARDVMLSESELNVVPPKATVATRAGPSHKRSKEKKCFHV